MTELPDEKTLAELVELGKSFEEQTRKLYEIAQAFAQKYEKRMDEIRLTQVQNCDERITGLKYTYLN